MKYIAVITLFLLASMTCFSQVSFSKFKFIKDSPFGCCPGRKATDVKFKVTGDKEVKYVRVLYVGVNQVGDAVSGQVAGAVNAGKEPLKHRYLDLTGPFSPGENYSRWASNSFLYPQKVTAFPLQIDIIYRNGTKEMVVITKENIKVFFPSVKWMEVNMEGGI